MFPRPGARQERSSFPETQLVAILVVAVKLFHPFDQLQRKSRSRTEPGVLGIDWKVWCDSQAGYEAKFSSDGRIGRGNILSVNEHDVMKMSGTQLDEYLDWFEQTWLDEERLESHKKAHPMELLDMFPIGRLDGSSFAQFSFDEESKIDQASVDRNLTAVQRSLNMRDVISEDQEGKSNIPVRRVGSFYKRYRKAEDLTPLARKFYETVASLVGISLPSLLRAVLQTERKLWLWRRKELKDEREDSEYEVSEDHREVIGEDGTFHNDEDGFNSEEADGTYDE